MLLVILFFYFNFFAWKRQVTLCIFFSFIYVFIFFSKFLKQFLKLNIYYHKILFLSIKYRGYRSKPHELRISISSPPHFCPLVGPLLLLLQSLFYHHSASPPPLPSEAEELTFPVICGDNDKGREDDVHDAYSEARVWLHPAVASGYIEPSSMKKGLLRTDAHPPPNPREMENYSPYRHIILATVAQSMIIANQTEHKRRE